MQRTIGSIFLLTLAPAIALGGFDLGCADQAPESLVPGRPGVSVDPSDGEESVEPANEPCPAGLELDESRTCAGWFLAGDAPQEIAFPGATATRLRDGRVLFVGGLGPENAVSAAAWLFDPSNDTWSAAAPLATARADHAAVLLNDGRVMVAGGFVGTGAGVYTLPSVELYDPIGDRWSHAACLGPRYGFALVVLADDRVLAIGGSLGTSGPSNDLSSARLYDPAQDQWTDAPSTLHTHPQARALRLPDERVLVFGGGPAELFDHEQWIEAAGAPEYGSMTLIDGEEIVAVSNEGATRWDPNLGEARATAAMKLARQDHVSMRLDDGRVLVAGGWHPYNAARPVPECEVYDPIADRWSTTASSSFAQPGGLATLLLDGRVLVAGEPAQLYVALPRGARSNDPR